MPCPFKIGAVGTDAGNMSDTVVNDNPDVKDTGDAFLTDGEAPRLGTSRPMVSQLSNSSVFGDVDSGPVLPVVSNVLTDGSSPTLPTLPTAAQSAPVVVTAPDTAGAQSTLVDGDTPQHPMAHLMPAKMKPTEASIRAAEARAVKKKKAKKIKIAVIAGGLVFTAVVGPPLGRWLVDAINEAGSTKPDTPAVTVAPEG
jgi:hypothetical protein